MQTQTIPYFLTTTQGQQADNILRSCVHCGFCLATCPTYQLLGDERDSPRGRIYLIKQVMEGQTTSSKTQTHLDRCLSCRACETSCPSGVQYGHLLDIGRQLVDKQTPRPISEQLKRYALRKILPYPHRFALVLKTGQLLKRWLPETLTQQIPSRQKLQHWPNTNKQAKQTQGRKMLLLQGCVQSIATPNTNFATVAILQKLGIELVAPKKAGCCGAVSQHLSAQQEAQRFMRANIDAWWPYIEQGLSAIVITASGCGVQVKDYAQLLQHDRHYAEKARRVSELAKDISQILAAEELTMAVTIPAVKHIAFQNPCTLQHGQKLSGLVESILEKYGFQLSPVDNTHLCCGSAGTYSLLQPDLSQQLLHDKLTNLQKKQPELIVTANVGCQLHLQSKASIPVKHWIELLNDSLQ